jgi:hypothetical protein
MKIADRTTEVHPRCRCCKQTVTRVEWRRFSDGTVHLVFWCCGRQVGDPLPKTQASAYGCIPHAMAQITTPSDRLF